MTPNPALAGDFNPTLVVMPFTDGTGGKGDATDAKVREFESLYLPGRLLTQLEQRGVNAHFAPSITPAADFYLKGSIVKSDGENLALNLELDQAGGVKVWSKKFSTSMRSKDFSGGREPLMVMFEKPVKQIQKSLASTTPQAREAIVVARLAEYRGVPREQIQVNEQTVKIADTAANVEREKLLKGFTAMVEKKADSLKDAYMQWEEQSCQIAAQRRSEIGAAWTSGILTGLSIIAGGLAQSTGDYVGAANMQEQATVLAEMTAQSSARAAELGNSIEQLKVNFAGDVEPVTVNFLDQVYTLNGDLSSQMEKFRQIVRERLGQ